MSLNDFAIVDTTLREGEQFVQARFSSDDKVEIASALSDFGVEYVEVTSPCASTKSREDCARLARLGLRSKVLTHIRCSLDDAKAALETGVGGINVLLGTSRYLRQFSHGRSIEQIIDSATSVLSYLHDQNPLLELRFSAEDTFRTSTNDLVRVYSALEALDGISRYGLADTVGIATPRQVYELTKIVRGITRRDIEFHGHNDADCAVANSHAALEAGATHVDTTILGIGERNGITSLEGFIARMYLLDRNRIASTYDLARLPALSQLVATKVGLPVPFNQCITGLTAFTHKAGIHVKAMLQNRETYEALAPEDFGRASNLAIAHQLTGWNAIQGRANQLGLDLDTGQIKEITRQVKDVADARRISLEDVDDMLLSASLPSRDYVSCA